jgi:hypothetical protein
MRVLRGLLLGMVLVLAGLFAGGSAWASGRGGVFAHSVLAPAVVPLISGEPPVVSTEGASAVGVTGATLNGSVNPEEGTVTDCHFAYVDEAHYQPEATDPYAQGATVPCSSIPLGSEPTPVSAEVSGLSTETRYHFQLYVTNGGGEAVGGDQSFVTAGSPTVEGLAVSEVGAAKATVSAEVDPHGLATMYRFQYGTSEAYGSETTEVEVSGEEPVAVSAKLTGLAPGSEYHLRILATNTAGSEQTVLVFHTLAVGVQGLPDKRVFEMVTPVENEDANVYVPRDVELPAAETEEGIQTSRPFRVSVDGDRVVYVAAPTSGGNGEAETLRGNDYLATRSPVGGWTQANVEPPGRYRPIYQGFSSDLSTGILASGSGRDLNIGLSPLSPEAPGEGYNVLYERTFSEEAYRPFFTKAPLPLTAGEFGAYEGAKPVMGGQPGPGGAPVYAGSSADFTQSLFEANGAFTTNTVTPPIKGDDQLYDRIDGQLSLVNVLPDGVAEANATFGAPSFVNSNLDPNSPDFSHVISEDGSRVFWTDLNTGVLYVGEDVGTSAARTVQVDASQGPGEGGGGRFWTASSDGSEVFFTDCSRLTSDSTAVSGEFCARGPAALSGVDPGSDLYEYDVESGRLSDLTVDHNPSDSLAADVQGVIGASDDGEYVYFVAEGSLAVGANTGAFNLYVWHAGVTTFIAALSGEDGSAGPKDESAGPYGLCPNYGCGEIGDWQPGLGHRTAEVTGDGQSLVFMSNQSLKTYPSGRTYTNNGLQEVYTYDAAENRLFCVSCSPTGEAPSTNHEGAAAFLPVSWSYTYIQRWISEDGSRVFFDSDEPLVPQDTDGTQDAYEWERDGTGNCREVAGCVYLLSGGTSSTNSWLLGASASGDDVFVITRAQLVPQDRGETYDVYDARVEGVGQSSSPVCTGGECQAAPSTVPGPETPSSVMFNGPENPSPPVSGPVAKQKKVVVKSLTRAQKLAKALAACRKVHGKHRRSLCEAQARKRYIAKSKARKPAKKGSR